MSSEQVDIGPEAREVVSRLSRVDILRGAFDTERAGRAFEEFLRGLGLAPRPLRWASDAREADRLVEGRGAEFSNGEVSHALGVAARRPGKVSRHAEADGAANSAAVEAGRGRVLNTLYRGVVEHMSVVTASGEFVWENRWRVGLCFNSSRDVLGDAASSAGELARIHATGLDSPESRAFAGLKLPMLEAFEAGVWLYWLARAEVVVIPRPAFNLREGRLHGDCVPAVSWATGAAMHFLNGVMVPERVAMTPARELESRMVVEERNAEVRREIVRKIGVERVVMELGAVCVDRHGDYELLLLDLGDGRRRPFLKMKNPSVPGVIHIEGVHPDCTTVRAALAWRNGTDVPPALLT